MIWPRRKRKRRRRNAKPSPLYNSQAGVIGGCTNPAPARFDGVKVVELVLAASLHAAGGAGSSAGVVGDVLRGFANAHGRDGRAAGGAEMLLTDGDGLDVAFFDAGIFRENGFAGAAIHGGRSHVFDRDGRLAGLQQKLGAFDLIRGLRTEHESGGDG